MKFTKKSPNAVLITAVVVSIIAISFAISLGQGQLLQSSNQSSSTNATIDDHQVLTGSRSIEPVINSQVIFGNGVSSQSSKISLQSKTMVLESFQMPVTGFVGGIATELVIPTASEGSSITLGYYVNGCLERKQSYMFPVPPTPSSGGTAEGNQTATFWVPVQATVSAGTNISVAFFCTGQVFVFTTAGGQTVEYPSVSALPSVVPSTSTASALPDTVDIFGFANSPLPVSPSTTSTVTPPPATNTTTITSIGVVFLLCRQS